MATAPTSCCLHYVNEHGVELRWASRRASTWPGYACPLGRAGWWLGDARHHVYIGRSRADRDEAVERMGAR